MSVSGLTLGRCILRTTCANSQPKFNHCNKACLYLPWGNKHIYDLECWGGSGGKESSRLSI